MAQGLITYPMGGTIDSQRGDHVLLAPPFIVTAEEIEMIADGFAAALEGTVSMLRAAA